MVVCRYFRQTTTINQQITIMDIYIVDAKGTNIMPSAYERGSDASRVQSEIVQRLQQKGYVTKYSKCYGYGAHLDYMTKPQCPDVYVSSRLSFLR